MDYKYLSSKQISKLDKLLKEYKKKQGYDLARLNDVSDSKLQKMLRQCKVETSTLYYDNYKFKSQVDGTKVSSKLYMDELPHKSMYKKIRVVGVVLYKGSKKYFVALYILVKEGKKYVRPKDSISLGVLASNGFQILPYYFYVMNKTSYRQKVMDIVTSG